jgi:hypothetical protein
MEHTYGHDLPTPLSGFLSPNEGHANRGTPPRVQGRPLFHGGRLVFDGGRNVEQVHSSVTPMTRFCIHAFRPE